MQTKNTDLIQCTRCVLDTTDPNIRFDNEGVCNYCHFYEQVTCKFWYRGEDGKQKLEALIREMKAYGEGKEYDCIIGLSGGVDSSYLAYLCSTFGLRMLAVHVDAGWNSELAVKNIESICKTLNIDLVTHVINWPAIKEIQRAFLKSRVINQDIPQDHAFFAALYKYAEENKIKYVINGYNIATENTLPSAWQGYTAMDPVHIRAIYKKHGRGKFPDFPTLDFWKYTFYYPRVLKMQLVSPFNYIDYNKFEAINLLQEKLGWRSYGAKHNESRFTKFHQNYYLPKMFNIEKRKAHLASLVISGQMSRAEAVEELSRPIAPELERREDAAYVAKKLGFTMDEFDAIMTSPPGRHEDYPASQTTYKKLVALYKKWFRK